jgi:hypothetical protein
MMEHRFTFNLEVEGMCVAQVEGVANIIPHGDGWRIGSIALDGRDMGHLARSRVDVLLPETHFLWTRIALHLAAEHDEIDWRWNRREQEAA